MNKYLFGFSLLELMIVLTIASILAVVAAPSFTNQVENYRVRTNISLFQGSLVYARSESSKRSATITVCRTDDGAACSTDSDTGWEAGWLVFIDVDADMAVDAGVDEVMKVVNALSGFTLTSTRDAVSYRSNGSVTGAQFDLCPTSGSAAYARAIDLKPSGRPRVLTSGVSCT